MPFFWSYLSHFILDFDGVKCKVGLLNPCNLSNYLASPPASLPEIPWLAIIFLVIYPQLQVEFWWCRKLKLSLIPAWAELGPAQSQLVICYLPVLTFCLLLSPSLCAPILMYIPRQTYFPLCTIMSTELQVLCVILFSFCRNLCVVYQPPSMTNYGQWVSQG